MDKLFSSTVETLRCNNCNDLINIPCIITCCKNSELHCITCFYKAYVVGTKLDDYENIHNLEGNILCLNKCKCKLYIEKSQTKWIPSIYKYNDKTSVFYPGKPLQFIFPKFLYQLRNVIPIKLKCIFHPHCQDTFNSTDELFDHIEHKCLYGYSECSFNGCNYTNYKFKVDKHIELHHSYIECHICQIPIKKNEYIDHISVHGSNIILNLQEGYLNKSFFKKKSSYANDLNATFMKSSCACCNVSSSNMFEIKSFDKFIDTVESTLKNNKNKI